MQVIHSWIPPRKILMFTQAVEHDNAQVAVQPVMLYNRISEYKVV